MTRLKSAKNLRPTGPPFFQRRIVSRPIFKPFPAKNAAVSSADSLRASIHVCRAVGAFLVVMRTVLLPQGAARQAKNFPHGYCIAPVVGSRVADMNFIEQTIRQSGFFCEGADISTPDALRKALRLSPEPARSLFGYEGLYAVTESGQVWSFRSAQWLKASMRGGYPCVGLNRPCVPQYSIAVHILVARAWVPNPYNLPVVNHMDGDKMNACASNLEWVTHADNLNHALTTGLRRSGTEKQLAALRRNSQVAYRNARRLTRDDICLVDEFLKAGVTQRSVGWFFGMRPSVIGRIINHGYRSL